MSKFGFLESHGEDKVVGTFVLDVGEVARKLTAVVMPEAADAEVASMAGELSKDGIIDCCLNRYAPTKF